MNNEYSLDNPFSWSEEAMLEVILPDPNAFLKIKETLSRIGIPSKGEQKLTQSVHILHKRGKYYIMHFLELFSIDGRDTIMLYSDIGRRNRIAMLLQEWKLCTIVLPQDIVVPLNYIKIIPFKEKNNWVLVSNYTVGVPHTNMRKSYEN
jgi:hypothetical protein